MERNDEWQPIATAPRNGDSVLLYAAAWSETWGSVLSGFYMDGKWYVGEGTVADNDADFDPDADITDENGDVPDDFDWEANTGPTHWRPLPAPPHSEAA